MSNVYGTSKSTHCEPSTSVCSKQLPTAQAALLDARLQLAEVEQQAGELIVRSPVEGIVVAPPQVESDAKDDFQLPKWSGSPLEPKNLGCWIEPGAVLCTVSPSKEMEAIVAIDQADVTEVQVGQSVKVLLDSMPWQVLEGEVLQVARRATEMPPQGTSFVGQKYHLVQVELKQTDPALLIGARGRAKIEASRMTLGQMAGNELRQMFQLPW